jgi:hypothetical protein
MKKTIEYLGKSYTLTTPVGNCFECKYEEPCKNFHCVSAMCGITGFCLGYSSKTDDCPFKETKDDE